MYHIFFSPSRNPPAVHLITAVLIVLVVLPYSPNKRGPLTASANDFEEESIFSNRAKTLLYLQYGKAPANVDFICFANKGVNHRHRKSRPGIPRDSPRFVFQFARGAANHFLRKNLRNLRNGTMVTTVACRYFPSAKRRS